MYFHYLKQKRQGLNVSLENVQSRSKQSKCCMLHAASRKEFSQAEQ